MKRLLVVDDDEIFRREVENYFTDEGYDVSEAGTIEEAQRQLWSGSYDAALVDCQLPDGSGLQFIETARQAYPRLPIVAMSSMDSTAVAFEASKKGASQYFGKPLDLQRVLSELEEVDGLTGPRNHHGRPILTTMGDAEHWGEIIGKSPAIKKLFRELEAIAKVDVTILLRGESGTGKEVVARSLHQKGKRCDKPFVAVHCAAMTESLLESELFGHEKGAFTGATSRHPGRFELANGGTLFLDEIGELPLSVQTKLLRVLQERKFERVGGTESITTDVQIIAATHRPLEEMLRKGTFREDLYYRLNVVPVKIPPLRERREDIPMLARYFLKRFAQKLHRETPQLEPGVYTLLMHHDWPGNVRELENVMQRGLALSPNTLLTHTDFAFLFRDNKAPAVEAPPASANQLNRSLDEVERDMITQMLLNFHGNVSKASQKLGISRDTMYRKMRKYHIERQEIYRMIHEDVALH